MGETIVVDEAKAGVLGKALRELNPTLTDEDVGALVGEAILGRAFRAPACPQCGGRRKVVVYPEGVAPKGMVAPVWADCRCSAVRGESSLDGVPLSPDGGMSERLISLARELVSMQQSLGVAQGEVARVQLELQQSRQVNMGAQAALKDMSRQGETLSDLLRSACVLLRRACSVLPESEEGKVLRVDIEKFMDDK
jgi:hypothetical protein